MAKSEFRYTKPCNWSPRYAGTMGGSPCGGPKRSAAGKKSTGETFGRYEARPPAAKAACVHNDTHTERTAARTKPATRRSEAAKGLRAMEHLKAEWPDPGGRLFHRVLNVNAGMSPLTARVRITGSRQCRLTPEDLICLVRTKWIEFAPAQTRAGQLGSILSAQVDLVRKPCRGIMPLLRTSLLMSEPAGTLESLDELFALANAMEEEAANRYAALGRGHATAEQGRPGRGLRSARRRRTRACG